MFESHDMLLTFILWVSTGRQIPKGYLALVGSLCCVNLFDMPIQVIRSGMEKEKNLSFFGS